MNAAVARSLTLALLLATGATAQETTDSAAEIDDFEPAVSSETLSGMGSADSGDAELAAPTAVLASDVKRTSTSSGVMDEIDLDASEVTGNQELPKVLYIVPWQKSEAGELVGKPVNTLLQEVLAPVDRSEFIRQVDYYGDLYGEDEER